MTKQTVRRRIRRAAAIVVTAASLLTLTLVAGVSGPAAAFPACDLPADFPKPPTVIGYLVTCEPWSGMEVTDLRHRFARASAGPTRHAWVTVYNPPVNAVAAGPELFDEFLESIEIHRTDIANDPGVLCYINKWIKGDQGVNCRYPRAVKPTAKFTYVIRYLQRHGISTEQHTVTGMLVL